MTLDDHLAEAMNLSGLRIGVRTLAHERLRLALEGDDVMCAEARKRLADTPVLSVERDHIGFWLRDTLRGALPKE